MGGYVSAAAKEAPEVMTVGSLLIGPPPADWDTSKTSIVHASIADPISAKIEPVGPHYLAHARRKVFGRTFSEDEDHLASLKAAADQASFLQASQLSDDHVELEPDYKEDLKRDPRDWKTQDHYRLLGLGKIRWKATPAMIKKAHRTKVLVHHPDKKASAAGGGSENTHDDEFFKCIQKAYEILSDPTKRWQYDSVDPIPEESYNATKEMANHGTSFLEAWQKVFDREARFFVGGYQNVVKMGSMQSSKEEVEGFYSFWYGFESFRSFEYLDKEDNEDAENRDNKRYLEKKNKAERASRKKEDSARLRKLVDAALASDPRIAAFKEQEKEAKEAKKREKEKTQNKQKLQDQKKKEENLALEKEKLEKEAQQKEQDKKEKEQKKKQVRKEKKNIKNIIKDENYFRQNSTPVAAETIEIFLSELESLLDKLNLEELEKLSVGLEKAGSRNQKHKVLQSEAERLVKAGLATVESLSQFSISATIESTPATNTIATTTTSTSKGKETASTSNDANKPTKEWSVEEVALLIKAANKFPGGVSDRWNTIGAYVALHTGLPQRNSDDVIKKSKEVQKGTSQEATVKQLQFQKRTYEIADAPSVRYDIEGEVAPVVPSEVVEEPVAAVKKALAKKKPAAASTSTATKTTTTTASLASTKTPAKAPKATPAAAAPAAKAPTVADPTPAAASTPAPATVVVPAAAEPAGGASAWTATEQKQLESALKTYPPSWKGEGERWDKIAESIPGRTKKDCKLRVKYLQEQVKAQKAAAAASSK